MRLALITIAALSGCTIGGRLTGGVLAGDGGVDAFALATVEVGAMDHSGAMLDAEVGQLDDTATHAGLRYRAGGDDRVAWTGAAAVETSPGGTTGQLTAGLSVVDARTTDDRPDVIAGTVLGVDLEGVAIAGERYQLGAQLALQVLYATIMR